MMQKVIAFLYFWFLSAQLGPEQLGTYIWALSLTTMFSIGIDLGLSPLLIREAARDSGRAERLLRGVVALKTMFGLVALVILLTLVFFPRHDPVTLIVVSIAALVMIFDSFAMSFWGVLRSLQKIKYESTALLIFHILVFALGAYLLGIAQSPISAIIALATGSFAILVFAWVIVRFRFGVRTSPLFEHSTLHALLRLLPAFAIAGIFMRLYNATDSVLLGYFVSNEAVGLYSIPAKAITALQMLIPGAFLASIYPAMSYYFVNSRQKLEQLFERSVGYLIIIAFPITAGLLALIPKIIGTIWPEYVAVIPTFILMSFALPFLFLSFPTGYMLNAINHQRQNTINRGVITAINISLNFALIPKLGVQGAGIAFLVSNIILVFLDFRNVHEVMPVVWIWLKKIIVKSAVASILMGLILVTLRNSAPLVVLVLLGMVTYAVIILVLQIFTKAEITFIKEIIQQGNKRDIKPEEVV